MEQLNILKNNCLEQLKIIEAEIERINNENWKETSMNVTFACGFNAGYKGGYKKNLFTGNAQLSVNHNPMAEEVLETLILQEQVIRNKTDIVWLGLAEIMCRDLISRVGGINMLYLKERLRLMTVNSRLYLNAIKKKDIKMVYENFDCVLQLMKVFGMDQDNYRGDLNAIEIIKNAGVDISPFSMFFDRIVDDLIVKINETDDNIFIELIQKNLLAELTVTTGLTETTEPVNDTA